MLILTWYHYKMCICIFFITVISYHITKSMIHEFAMSSCEWALLAKHPYKCCITGYRFWGQLLLWFLNVENDPIYWIIAGFPRHVSIRLNNRWVSLRHVSIRLNNRCVSLRHVSIRLNNRWVSLRHVSIRLNNCWVSLRHVSIRLNNRWVSLRHVSIRLNNRWVSLRHVSVRLNNRWVSPTCIDSSVRTCDRQMFVAPYPPPILSYSSWISNEIEDLLQHVTMSNSAANGGSIAGLNYNWQTLF